MVNQAELVGVQAGQLSLVLEGRDGLGILLVGSTLVIQRDGSSRVEAHRSEEAAMARACRLCTANDF